MPIKISKSGNERNWANFKVYNSILPYGENLPILVTFPSPLNVGKNEYVQFVQNTWCM